MVIAQNSLLGQYYGLQGTTWMDPPIIKSPTEIVNYGGRKFMVFKDASRVRLVAWQTKGGTYWISNTLLQTISKNDMLAIARACKPLG
jgi:hypothetical protein